jgi:hypothetical protein
MKSTKYHAVETVPIPNKTNRRKGLIQYTNKTYSHDIAEVVLKAALNTITIITKSPKSGAIVIIANRYFDPTMHES